MLYVIRVIMRMGDYKDEGYCYEVGWMRLEYGWDMGWNPYFMESVKGGWEGGVVEVETCILCDGVGWLCSVIGVKPNVVCDRVIIRILHIQYLLWKGSKQSWFYRSYCFFKKSRDKVFNIYSERVPTKLIL